MAARQFGDKALAELGIRSVEVGVGESLERAADALQVESSVLSGLVFEARRNGRASAPTMGLSALVDGSKVVILSTAAIRGEALAWAGVAHELGNALTTIAGWAEVAVGTHDPTKAREAIEMVQLAAREAMDVAPVLLEQRADAERAEPAKVVRQVIDRFTPLAQARGVTLALRRIDAGEVDASRTAVASIAANLVKNAIESCARGGKVEIGVRGSTRTIELIVEDTGRGMDEETVRTLFAPRVAAREGRALGRGIGLSVVRALVQRAGGTARASSQPGAGSCIRVELPRARARSAGSGVRSRTRAKRVLVVEDHASLAELLRATIEARGADVVCTRHPHEAIAAAEEAPFDLALVDLDLGGTSGAPLIEAMMKRELAAKVVVMSGAPVDGGHAVLRKPFDLTDVEDLVEEAAPKKSRRAR
jgi:signal transduction histidine kinase